MARPRIITDPTRTEGGALAAASVALFIIADAYVNPLVRRALTSALGDVPLWVDQVFLMLLVQLLLALGLGLLLLDRREAGLVLPERLAMSSAVAVGAGVVIAVTTQVALTMKGQNVVLHPSVGRSFVGLLAHVEEELVYRAVLLGILMKYVKSAPLSVLICAAVFARSFSNNAPLVVAQTFVGGAVFGALVARYRSLVPALVSRLAIDAMVFAYFSMRS